MTINIDQLQALVDGMTAGKWATLGGPHEPGWPVYVGKKQVALVPGSKITQQMWTDEDKANAAGIVALRNSADALLSRLRAAERLAMAIKLTQKRYGDYQSAEINDALAAFEEASR